MYRSGWYAAGLLILTFPAPLGTEGAVRLEPDDPLEEIVEALDQGRHWYAARLLRKVNGGKELEPEASLLAARADAGRGAWPEVTRRLEGAPWLDSLGQGAGRALLARGWLETGEPARAIRDYRTFLAYSPERAPRAFAEIGLGRALAELDHAQEAASAFSRAAEAAPELEPWLAIRAAEHLAPGGDTARVRQLLERSIGVPFHRRAVAYATARLAAGDRDGALRGLLDDAAAPEARERSSELKAHVARLLLEEADTAAAGGVLRAALTTQPSRALDAAELLSNLPNLTPQDHRSLGHAFDRSGAPDRAAEHYRQYLERVKLTDAEHLRLQLKLGELLFRAGSYARATAVLEELRANAPQVSLQARAEYLIARATYRRGWRREGRARLRDIADRYAGTTSALRSLSLLADLYESAGNAARARDIYEEIVDRYPGSGAARRARYRMGILAFINGELSTARLHFDRLRRSNRAGNLWVSATYWAARARLAQAEPDGMAEAERLLRAVQARDPFGYYGLLASDRLAVDPWSELPPGPEPAALEAEVIRQLEVLDLLRKAGLAEEAQALLESITALRPKSAEAILALSYALAEHGLGRDAVRFGWRAHARLGLWSASVLRAVYPLAYRDIILAEARDRELDPYLVAAIARQESAFASDAVSRAGARGLLQLMPETGRWWAGRMGVRDYDEALLFHPETNVHLGAAYFADLQRRYGELQLALVAYNAGPTRAQRWRERPSYRVDGELFAERIPFSETRTYVRSVQTHYRIYRNLYHPASPGEPAD